MKNLEVSLISLDRKFQAYEGSGRYIPDITHNYWTQQRGQIISYLNTTIISMVFRGRKIDDQ